MPRLTASQISLMKQFFAQIGAVDSTWITGNIPVDQIGGATNWFTDLFDSRLGASADAIITDQSTQALSIAQDAYARANEALAAATTPTLTSGSVVLPGTTTVVTAADYNNPTSACDLTDLTCSLTLSVETDLIFAFAATITCTSNGNIYAYLGIDGTLETLRMSASKNRAPSTDNMFQIWRVTLAAGEHTIIPRVCKDAGTITLTPNETTLTWWQV